MEKVKSSLRSLFSETSKSSAGFMSSEHKSTNTMKGEDEETVNLKAMVNDDSFGKIPE